MGPTNGLRKALHLVAGLALPLGLVVAGWTGSVVAALFAWGLLVVAWDAHRRGTLLPLVAVLTSRRGPEPGLVTSVQYTTSLVLLLLLFPPPYAAAAAGLLALGDGASGLVGRRWGRHPLPWNARKTWEGLAGGVLVGTPAAVLLALAGTWLSQQGYAGPDEPAPLLPAWAVVPLAALAYLLAAGVLRILIANGRIVRRANAAPADLASALAVAAALPLAFLWTVPAFLSGPLLPLLGGHGPGTKALLVLVAPFVMLGESAVNRRDNLGVPLVYAALAYLVVFLGQRL